MLVALVAHIEVLGEVQEERLVVQNSYLWDFEAVLLDIEVLEEGRVDLQVGLHR